MRVCIHIHVFNHIHICIHAYTYACACRYLPSEQTALQGMAWPLLMEGRDVVAIANTGSGKTAGFLLPALWHVARQLTQVRQWRNAEATKMKVLAYCMYRCIHVCVCVCVCVLCLCACDHSCVLSCVRAFVFVFERACVRVVCMWIISSDIPSYLSSSVTVMNCI